VDSPAYTGSIPVVAPAADDKPSQGE
jgi:hypothetical protein